MKRSHSQDLLLTGTPSEVLARIVPDDPLGLGPLISSSMEQRALLVELERVLLRAQALCAQRARDWRGDPDLGPWLAERVEEALESVLAEDPDEEDALGLHHPWTPLALPLGLDARTLSEACARFNRLSPELREAFFALVLDALGPDRAARSRGLSLTEFARRARTALELFRPGVAQGQAAALSPGHEGTGHEGPDHEGTGQNGGSLQ